MHTTASDDSARLPVAAAGPRRMRAVGRRSHAAASAGGTVAILAGCSLFATSLLASTRPGSHMFASERHAVAPQLGFEKAHPLLMVVTALAMVTLSTWLMLLVAAPREGRRRARQRLELARPRSRVQRHRSAIVLAGGVTPVLLGGGLPFAAKFLPLGFQIDVNSAVGSNWLDLVLGLAVPATLLAVLYFRWVARLAGVADDSAPVTASGPPKSRPEYV
jgi:hypothetical protein